MKTLIYAEKPDMGRNIAAVLGKERSAFKKGNGYMESDEFVVTWGFGHLYSAKLPEHYGEFGGWNWEAIPFYPPNGHLDFKLPDLPAEANAEQKARHKSLIEHAKTVDGLFKRKDITNVVNACDAGREGDLIFWIVYDQSGVKKPIKRLWISDLTEETISKGFKSLRDEAFFMPKREAAYARSFADWALGMNLTVAFSVKAREKSPGGKLTLHVGRVQTPTLSLLVQRRLEIENFVPRDYFEIEAAFGGKYKGLWFKNEKGNTEFEKQADAQAVVDKVTGKIGEVVKKEVKEEKEYHKLLYSLTSLQREANQKFGFSAQKTLDIAQELYEKYKFTSYPRTDSEYLSTGVAGELPDILKSLNHGDYAKFASHILASGVKTTSRFVNDKEVADHHAIIPTKKKADLSSIAGNTQKGLSASDIAKLYDMIAKRFLSVFYPPAVYEKTEIITEVERETFKTSGKILISAGWKEIYGKEAEDEEAEEPVKKGGAKQEATPVVKLPPIAMGEQNPVTKADLLAKKTQPPKHYTEAELLKVMDNPKKFLENEELQKALAEANEGRGAGLGTPATRAQTIETLKKRKYVDLKGKSLIATDFAVSLIQIAPEALRSPMVTAEWEQKLKQIELKQIQRDDFEGGIQKFVQQNIDALKSAVLAVEFQSAGGGGKEIGKCPQCGKPVTERKTIYICESHSKDQPCFIVGKELLGKKISESNVKQLLDKHETGEIKGFKHPKTGNKFDAKLSWQEGKVSFGGLNRNMKKETDMKCPACQGEIVEREKMYACENSTQQNPCVTIYKSIAGKNLTEKQIKQLIQTGATDVIEGFKSKAGKPFGAKLKINGKRVDFDFPERQEFSKSGSSGLKCPICQTGDITESGLAFGCSNYKAGCKFTLWKNKSKKFTIKSVETLIKTSKTETCDDFVNQKGVKFKAYYELNPKEKKVEIRYVNEK